MSSFPCSIRRTRSTKSFRRVGPPFAWQGIGVQFFGKLFLPRNRRHTDAGQAGKTKPIPALQHLVRLAEHVASADIQMELREAASGHLCVHRKTRAAIRRGIKIKRRVADSKIKTIIEIDAAADVT